MVTIDDVRSLALGLTPSHVDLRYNWLLVRLAAIDKTEMRELVFDAWTMVVPKRVVAAYRDYSAVGGRW